MINLKLLEYYQRSNERNWRKLWKSKRKKKM